MRTSMRATLYPHTLKSTSCFLAYQQPLQRHHITFAVLLQRHYTTPAVTLQRYCIPFAALLQNSCSVTAKVLQQHCKRSAVTVQEVCSSFAVSLSVKQGTTYRDTPILISNHLFSFDISEAPLSMLVPFHQSFGRANPRNAPRDSSRGYVPVRAVARSLSDAWEEVPDNRKG